MRQRAVHIMVAAVSASFLLAGPAAADDSGWMVRARAAWVDPDFSRDTVNDDGTRVSAFDRLANALDAHLRQVPRDSRET